MKKHITAAAVLAVLAAGAGVASGAATTSATPAAARPAANHFTAKAIVEVAPRRLAPQTPAGTVFVTFRLTHALPGGGAKPYTGRVRISGLGSSAIDRADFSRPRTRCYSATAFPERFKGRIGHRVRVTFTGLPGLPTTSARLVTRRLTSADGATKRLGCASKHL